MDTNFGNMKLPMPDHFSGEVEQWEDWQWNFKNYVSAHNPQAATLLTRIEAMDVEVTDALLEDGDPDVTEQRVTFSRKLHYLIALLTKGAARLVVRQLTSQNGYETWRNLYKNFALPGNTRHVGLLSRVLKPVFRHDNFEQDFYQWESLKRQYETQTGTVLPDTVLVALLLNETSGPLQQHLRLNAQLLNTYADVRNTLKQYYQSIHVMKQSTLPNSGPAPMDIGYFGRKGGKGGKGGKGFGYFPSRNFGYKGKGKGNFGNFRKGKGKGFGPKGKGKGKGKGKKGTFPSTTFGSSSSSGGKGKSSALCHVCQKPGHFARDCPDNKTVGAIDETFNEYDYTDEW